MASSQLSFNLPKEFTAPYHQKPLPFGFNGLGQLVYERTYSRVKEDGSMEDWTDTVERVVNGTYSMQKDHVLRNQLGWDEKKGLHSAKEMFERIFDLKFTPPGRGLWTAGTDAIFKKGLAAALNNCAFVSTESVATEFSTPFRFLMDMSMLGVGVGFDTKGVGTMIVKGVVHNRLYPYIECIESHVCHTRTLLEMITECEQQIKERAEEIGFKEAETDWTCKSLKADIEHYLKEIDYVYSLSDQQTTYFTIPDTREGWVESTGMLIDSYLCGLPPVVFDYTGIRKKGELLKTFGGLSSGPGPLIDMHIAMRKVLEKNTGKPLTVTTIVDLQNLIGRAVVAGNVRRSSEIALGEPESKEFIDLKNYNVNPERSGWGWCSNNSVMATLGMDYTDIAQRIKDNGEPGVIWMENIKAYSRMGHEPDYKDHRAKGTNPCSEQTLESKELCCLVEVFPARHESLEDFLRTLKFAYLYAKTVTLGTSHWAETNRVMLRNRRIGCSLSGIADFLGKRNISDLRKWCMDGYNEIQGWDKIYSDYLAIPRSIKTTSIKPSGSVSLLAGASPGVHFPISRCYIRRMRIMKDSHLIQPLIDAGYKVEPCIGSEKSTVVVEFPIKLDNNVRIAKEVSLWEKLELTALLQEHWSDNQVSVTADFDVATEGNQIKYALDHYQYRLKSLSFLPRYGGDKTPYPQMPYEDISEEQYDKMSASLKPIVVSHLKKDKTEEVEQDNYCDGEKCTFVPKSVPKTPKKD